MNFCYLSILLNKDYTDVPMILGKDGIIGQKEVSL